MFQKAKARFQSVPSTQWVNWYGFGSTAIYYYTAVILPLYLSQNGVSLEEIGILLSILPLVLTFFRIVLSVIADARGPGGVMVAAVASRTLASAAFAVSPTAPAVAVGSALSGAEGACYWSVNRAILYRRSAEGAAKSASKMQSYLSLGESAGRLVAGAAIQMAGFAYALWAATLASLALFAPAHMIRKKEESLPKKISWKRAIGLLDLRQYKPKTRKLVGYQAIGKVADALLFTFLLPLFLAESGFSFLEIGATLASCAALSGLTIMFLFRFRLLERHRSAVTAASVVLCAISAALLLALPTKAGIFGAICAIALADGFRNVTWEELYVESVRTTGLLKSDPSLAGAIFGVPINITSFATLFLAGFLASALGYVGVFVIANALNAAFLLIAAREVGKEDFGMRLA